MPLLVNLRHLEADDVRLEGELSAEELDIDTRDEMQQVEGPLQYDLEVQKVEGGLLVQGTLRLSLDCQCVRCLTPFVRELAMDWTRHLPLEGEEAAPVSNDCVDLTPYIREDMLLEFPQHPLCNPECGGLPNQNIGAAQNTSSTGQPEKGSPAWDELNKLKL
jgi:uncharacterized protein